MKSFKANGLLPLSGLLLTGTLAHSQTNSTKPNVIFILADDLGYTDINYFASLVTKTPASQQYYETPNIDKLAKQGVTFDQYYTCPLSSPARSSLLTGKYAARLGFMTATAGNANTFYAQGIEPPKGFLEQDCLWADKIDNPCPLLNGNTLIALPSGQPQDHGRNEITFAEAMPDYHSAFLGKWHVGGHGSEGYQPHNQGFEELAYYDSGSSQYFNWQKGWNRKEKYFSKMRQDTLAQGKSGKNLGIPYLTDDLTQRALDYIDDRTASKDVKPI